MNDYISDFGYGIISSYNKDILDWNCTLSIAIMIRYPESDALIHKTLDLYNKLQIVSIACIRFQIYSSGQLVRSSNIGNIGRQQVMQWIEDLLARSTERYAPLQVVQARMDI